MYAAFWIDPNAKTDNERVVIVRPFVEKPTIAWSILNAALREDRTGGVLAGPLDNIKATIDAIESKDQMWSSDADQMVAAITVLAERLGCTVTFKQNVRAVNASAWAVLDAVGLQAVDTWVTGNECCFRLRGPAESVSVAAQTVIRPVVMDQGDLVVRFDIPTESVQASAQDIKTENGESFQVKLPLDHVEDILELALGKASRPYRFCLLIKNQTRSIVFFGSKNTYDVRQAIAEYVEHLRADAVQLGSQDASEEQQQLLDSIVAPPTGHCRFWLLHR